MTTHNEPAPDEPTPEPTSVYDLVPGREYRVRTNFVDHYNTLFEAGDRLRFRQRHFLPYHGGHTLVFEPRSIYLQEEMNADILQNLTRYLEPV